GQERFVRVSPPEVSEAGEKRKQGGETPFLKRKLPHVAANEIRLHGRWRVGEEGCRAIETERGLAASDQNLQMTSHPARHVQHATSSWQPGIEGVKRACGFLTIPMCVELEVPRSECIVEPGHDQLTLARPSAVFQR